MQQGGDTEVVHNIQGGETTIIEGNLEELLQRKKQNISEGVDEDSGTEDEDETLDQYASDGGNENNDMCIDDEDDDDLE